MREQLKPYQEQFGFELDIVDVDEDPVLEEKYNELVPVFVGWRYQNLPLVFWTKKN